jgi:hypothetical protein
VNSEAVERLKFDRGAILLGIVSCPEVTIHLQRFSHRLERRFALKPDFKRQRALMQ